MSSNDNLKKINLSGNKLVDILYVYNGEKVNFNDGVKIGSKYINNKVVWDNQNKDIVDINFYDNAYALKDGSAVVTGESNLGYEVINNIHVVSISSMIYDILDNYIYVDNLNDFDIENIECNDENVALEFYYSSMELFVKYNNNILKRFVLVESDA